MRNISIEIEGPDFIELARNTDHVDLTETIGYLCTWGITGNYDTVRIFMDWHSKTDLVALYTSTENPERKYVMGAIWREESNKFTFHS
ncbi:hypothetical protein EBZ39_16185 [bacterium]|nr:hypothetical protein [bacterium]